MEPDFIAERVRLDYVVESSRMSLRVEVRVTALELAEINFADDLSRIFAQMSRRSVLPGAGFFLNGVKHR